MQKSLTKFSPLDHEKKVVSSHPGPRLLTSYNRHFVIKSIQSEQVAEMHRILTAYHQVCSHCTIHCALHYIQLMSLNTFCSLEIASPSNAPWFLFTLVLLCYYLLMYMCSVLICCLPGYFCCYRFAMFDPVSVICMLHMSRPSHSTFPNHWTV